MDRRTFVYRLCAGILTAPLAAEAQQAGKMYRIGILETTALVSNAANIDAFRQVFGNSGTLRARTS